MRLIFLAATLLASTAQAATFVVTTNAESGPGSLVAAITAANAAVGSSHRIEFVANVGLIDLLAPLPIITKENLEIDARSAPGVAIAPINPTAGFRLFQVSNTVDTLTLRGFTLRFGVAEGAGAGGGCVDGEMAKSTAVLTLDGMQLQQCSARYESFSRGGAVHWNGARIIALNSLFDSNSAISTGSTNFAQASGGALYGKELQLTRTRLTNNQTNGRISIGGAALALGNVTLLDSVWLDNLAVSTNSASGGALAADCAIGCLYDLRSSFFGRNQARDAGAIFARSTQFFSVLSLQNVSFVDNAVSGTFSTAAGAVSMQQVVLEARHVSFQGNTGPSAHFSMQNSSQLRLVHNSVFGTSATPGCLFTSVAQASSANITTDVNCAAGFTGNSPVSGLSNGPVAFNARMPVVAYGPSSPAIDRANPAECPGTDAIGTIRPQDGNGDGLAVCDVGAYELVDQMFKSGFEN